MTDALTVETGVPGGAIKLPLRTPEADLGPWSERTARERFGADADPEAVAAFADVLAGAAADARTRMPVLALSFCPDPSAGELARVEVSAMRVPDGVTPTLRDLAGYLAQPSDVSTGAPRITYGDLPIGPSVRVRHQYVKTRTGDRGPDAPLDDEGEGVILETVAYAALPPGFPHPVLMFMSWQALAYTDRLKALADKMAQTMKLVPVD